MSAERSSQRYRDALATLRLSMHGLAKVLGVHDTVARRWGMSRRDNPPPPELLAWLEALALDADGAEKVRTTPPPEWRTRPQ
jgi:hypothetical protein